MVTRTEAMRSGTLQEFDAELLLELLDHPHFTELTPTSDGLYYELHGSGPNKPWRVRMKTRCYQEIFDNLDWITKKRIRDEETYG